MLDPITVITLVIAFAEAISILDNLFGVLAVAGSAIFTLLYHFHKRLRKLESGGGSRDDTLHGEEDNPLNLGLIKEVSDIKTELNELQSDLDDVADENSHIRNRMTRLETKLDNLLKQLEDD